MARENSFTFFGELETPPVVLFNEETKTYRVTFTLKTVRRNGRKDHPKINVYSLDEETARAYVSALKPGVFVQLRGMVATKMQQKPVCCERCGEVSRIDSLQSEIISYGKPFVLDMKINPADITELANAGCLIGSLCTDVQRMDTQPNSTAIQFQLAVNRRYRVNELQKATRTDFPWIKVFGVTADECLKRLQVSSQVYISGAFQTRDVNRHTRCSHCGKQITYPERVGEVVPTGIEFLNNCLFEESEHDKDIAANEVDANEKK